MHRILYDNRGVTDYWMTPSERQKYYNVLSKYQMFYQQLRHFVLNYKFKYTYTEIGFHVD